MMQTVLHTLLGKQDGSENLRNMKRRASEIMADEDWVALIKAHVRNESRSKPESVRAHETTIQQAGERLAKAVEEFLEEVLKDDGDPWSAPDIFKNDHYLQEALAAWRSAVNETDDGPE